MISKKDAPFGTPIEIIKGKFIKMTWADRLFWMCDQRPPQNYSNSYFFCIDEVDQISLTEQDLKYSPFNKDFGPLNLAMVHRFCRELQRLLNVSAIALIIVQDTNYKSYRIFHYASMSPEKFANALFLMGAYMLIILRQSPSDVMTKFAQYIPHVKPFRDASKGDCSYECTVEHCLYGLYFALNH